MTAPADETRCPITRDGVRCTRDVHEGRCVFDPREAADTSDAALAVALDKLEQAAIDEAEGLRFDLPSATIRDAERRRAEAREDVETAFAAIRADLAILSAERDALRREVDELRPRLVIAERGRDELEADTASAEALLIAIRRIAVSAALHITHPHLAAPLEEIAGQIDAARDAAATPRPAGA